MSSKKYVLKQLSKEDNGSENLYNGVQTAHCKIEALRVLCKDQKEWAYFRIPRYDNNDLPPGIIQL